MGSATEEYWVAVLGEAVALLERQKCPHLVIGSLATGTYLDAAWNPNQDIDLFIPEDEADPLLDAFREQGYAAYRKDAGWLYKVARPNVTVDLIFRASATTELDEEMLRRGVPAEFKGVPIRIPAPEDLVVMKAITDTLERRGHWYDCLQLVQRTSIDWDYLVDRSLANDPVRLLAFLLYARTAGTDVPDRALKALAVEALL